MQAPLPEPTLRSSPFDLVTAIDAYEISSTLLVARWLDMELYADVSRQIDAIRERGVRAVTDGVLPATGHCA